MGTEPACGCADGAWPEADAPLGAFADLDAAIAEALLEAIADGERHAEWVLEGDDTTAMKRSAKNEVKQSRDSRVTLCRRRLAPPQGGEVEGIGWRRAGEREVWSHTVTCLGFGTEYLKDLGMEKQSCAAAELAVFGSEYFSF